MDNGIDKRRMDKWINDKPRDTRVAEVQEMCMILPFGLLNFLRILSIVRGVGPQGRVLSC